MTKSILIYDFGKCLGTIDVELAEDDLVSVFTVVDDNDNPLYILYVADMEYGIVVSKEIYCCMNEALNAAEEEQALWS